MSVQIRTIVLAGDDVGDVWRHGYDAQVVEKIILHLYGLLIQTQKELLISILHNNGVKQSPEELLTSLFQSGLIIAKNVTNMARHESEDGGGDGGASDLVGGCGLSSLLSAVVKTAAAGAEDSDAVLSQVALATGSCSTTVSCLVMSVERLAVCVETVVNGGMGIECVTSVAESDEALRTVVVASWVGSCSLAIVSGATFILLTLLDNGDDVFFPVSADVFFLVSAWRRTMERWYLYQSSERCFLTQLSNDISQRSGSAVAAASESRTDSNAAIVDCWCWWRPPALRECPLVLKQRNGSIMLVSLSTVAAGEKKEQTWRLPLRLDTFYLS